jgi:DNA polymerase III subunit delta
MADPNKQIFLWYGENDYEVFQQISRWSDLFVKKYSGLNITSFDLSLPGSKDQLQKDVKNALQVNSLFGSNKLIIFKNFLTKKMNKELQVLILETLDKLTDGFFVVFSQKEKPDARGKMWKELQKLSKKGLAEVKEYTLLQGSELTRWISSKAVLEQAKFEPGAIDLLVASVGNDLWQLDVEVKKLANYKKDEPITKKDVSLLVKGKYNDDIFQLMDSISEKNKKKALKLFNDQIDSGANEIYLLTMLIRQFRIFWQVKELMESGACPPDQVARELGIHPFVARKSVQHVERFKLKEIKDIYTKLLEMEIKMKTSQVNFEVLFGLLVAKLK